MASPRIIGLAGGAGCGKTTASEALMELGYEPRTFADNPVPERSLKEICANVFVPLGAELRHFFGTQDDKMEAIAALGGVSGRRILELVGTQGFRAAYTNVWADIGVLDLRPDVKYVFGDVRFPNEIDAIHRVGGVVILLRRSGVYPPVNDDPSVHESAAWWRLKTDKTWMFQDYRDAQAFKNAFKIIFESYSWDETWI